MPTKAKTKARAKAFQPRAMNKKRNTKKRRHNPSTRIVVIPAKRNKGKYHAKRNPHFFGANVNVVKLSEYVVGGLVGVTVNRIGLTMLPSSLTTTTFGAGIAALVLAGAEWWLASMFDKDFGSAVGFGALMNAGTQILNTVLPSVGGTIGLQGFRSPLGDFVPGKFVVPQTPVIDPGGMATAMMRTNAYPNAYAM